MATSWPIQTVVHFGVIPVAHCPILTPITRLLRTKLSERCHNWSASKRASSIKRTALFLLLQSGWMVNTARANIRLLRQITLHLRKLSPLFIDGSPDYKSRVEAVHGRTSSRGIVVWIVCIFKLKRSVGVCHKLAYFEVKTSVDPSSSHLYKTNKERLEAIGNCFTIQINHCGYWSQWNGNQVGFKGLGLFGEGRNVEVIFWEFEAAATHKIQMRHECVLRLLLLCLFIWESFEFASEWKIDNFTTCGLRCNVFGDSLPYLAH